MEKTNCEADWQIETRANSAVPSPERVQAGAIANMVSRVFRDEGRSRNAGLIAREL